GWSDAGQVVAARRGSKVEVARACIERPGHNAPLPRTAATMLDKLPDYPFTPHRLEVRPGIHLSYLDEGPRDGEVVVMVHGSPAWALAWARLLLGLPDGYRSIGPAPVGRGRPDRPGDGPSARPRYDYTLQSRVDDVGTLLGSLGITGPVTLAVHD